MPAPSCENGALLLATRDLDARGGEDPQMCDALAGLGTLKTDKSPSGQEVLSTRGRGRSSFVQPLEGLVGKSGINARGQEDPPLCNALAGLGTLTTDNSPCGQEM